MKNLSRKKKRGVYDPVLAAKLWRYWIDAAVKQYNKEILGGGYSLKQTVFTMADRKQAAIEMEEQEQEEIFGLEYLKNPSRRKNLARGIKGPWLLAAWDVRRVVYYGKGKWTPNRSKANVYKTEGRAKISAKLVVDEWNIQVAVANTATTHKQLQAALRPKK
jgi:hypothetical protein